MSDILEKLGIDVEDFHWYQIAACNGLMESIRKRVPKGEAYKHDPFFDAYESDPEVAKQTDQMCLGCPVIKVCYREAVERKEKGVWGGIYLDLGRVDETFNAHKTPEIWKQLRKIHGKLKTK